MSHNLTTRKRPREDEEDHNPHRNCPPQKRHENISAHDHADQHNGDRYHGSVTIYHGAEMAASASKSPEPTAVDSALESLMFEEMDARYLTVNALLAPSSCRWLLDREEYKRWQDDGSLSEHHGFLWIKGKAGAGKSTLMKFAFDNAEKTRCENKTIVSFFFNARGAPIERSLIGMYRALLYQILHKIPRLRPLLCKKRTLSAQSQDWSLTVLRSVFQDVIENLASEHLICYVDALDECPEDDAKEMVSLFEYLGDSSVTRGTKFHVCFASRHYPHITIEQSESIILEDQDGHTADILSYIKKKLKISHKALKGEMSNEIEKQASGVFLWVVLVVGILNDECSRGNVQMIRSRLKEIPTGLTELIQDILDRDKPTKYLVPLLQWILFSRRPLTLEELFLALQSIESETIRDSHTPEALARDNIDKFILHTSKGLAELTKGKKPKVQFIHELVRTHFLSPEGLVKLDPHLQTHLVGQSHDQLRKCCYNYFTSDSCNHVDLPTATTALFKAESPEGKRLRSKMLDTLPFLQYALENVLYHTNLAHLEGIEQTQFLESFPFVTWGKLHNAIARFTSLRHTRFVSQAYILAEQGCAALLAIAMESHPPPGESLERCRSILGAAVDARDIRSVLAVLSQEGYQNSLGKDNSLCMTHAIESSELAIVQALAAAKAKPYMARVIAKAHYKATKNNALLLAVSNPDKFVSDLGRFGLIRLLVGNLSDEDKARESCQEALHYARKEVCKHGDLGVFKLLYREGDSPLISDYMLCEASRSGDWQLVQLLLRLDPTLTVNTQYTSTSGGSMTPLSAASEAGHAHVVRCLLLEGADTNRGTNALAKAAANGHEAVIRILFDNGACLEGVDDDGSWHDNALYAAIAGGHVALARVIIQRGGTPNRMTRSETPLTLACRINQEEIVRMLLDNDADINLLDGNGTSPLASAIQSSRPDLARLFIERGANIHQICKYGISILFMAAWYSDEATVRLLIDKGADVNVRTSLGESLSQKMNLATIRRVLIFDDATRERQ